MSCAETATDYYHLTVMRLPSARQAEYSSFSLVWDFCRLPKDDLKKKNRFCVVLQCTHLIPSLLFPPLFPPPPPHRPRSFFSSSVGVILTSAPLTSSLDCIWPSGKRRQRCASSFSRKKPLHFSLIDESPIGRFHHLSSQERMHPGENDFKTGPIVLPLKLRCTM